MTDITPEYAAAIADLIGPPAPDLLDVQRQVWELMQRVEDLAVLLAEHRHCRDCGRIS